jgi:hypothetical protein
MSAQPIETPITMMSSSEESNSAFPALCHIRPQAKATLHELCRMIGLPGIGRERSEWR